MRNLLDFFYYGNYKSKLGNTIKFLTDHCDEDINFYNYVNDVKMISSLGSDWHHDTGDIFILTVIQSEGYKFEIDLAGSVRSMRLKVGDVFIFDSGYEHTLVNEKNTGLPFISISDCIDVENGINSISEFIRNKIELYSKLSN